MTEDARKARNAARLTTCYPPFASRIVALIAELEWRSFRPRIDQSWRTSLEHDQQVAAGTSHSSWSFHMATTVDGKPDALAVDLLDDDYPVPDAHQHLWPQHFRDYLLTLASLAANYDLHTGIAWDLPAEARIRLATALGTDPLSYDGPIGFDPTHIEPRSLSLIAAKVGKRPEW
jgi:hypothetical protein